MTEFVPIIRTCAGCGCDLSIHSLFDKYAGVVYENEQNICLECFIAIHELEPITSFSYKPHHIVWPDEIVFDAEAEEELAEELEVIHQMELWSEAV